MSKVLGIVFAAEEVVSMSDFANQIGLPLDLIWIGGGSASEAERNYSLPKNPQADAFVQALLSIESGYSLFCAVSGMASKDLVPRLAGKLEIPMAGDVTAIVAPKEFIRPIAAGAMNETVRILSERFAVTIRASSFKAGSYSPSGSESEPLHLPESKVTVLSTESQVSSRPDLAQAKVVVSGGKPTKDAASFERLIGGLADKLGGAAGATRAAVDSGIAPNELQVGQTGKVVAPDLYFAIGISGSTQHVAGMKDSKLIVAINTDKEAPIFDVADFGLVADLHQAVPELMSKLS